MKFDIENLIKTNSFFNDRIEIFTDKIKMTCNESFGEEIIMYYFYFKNYTISFIYDNTQNIFIGEQVEFKKIKEYQYDVFKKKYENLIESIYFEDEDYVILLANGVNIFFHKIHLKKITSKNNETRKLVYNTMKKIY